MDEPLGALDKKLREQMQIEIKRLHRSLGVTVIYVTHDQDEALTMSDRVAVIHQGQLMQIGPPIDLYLRPKNVFVADFVGKMNFVEATVVGSESEMWILGVGAATRIAVPMTAIASSLSPGQRVRAALRPEQLRLTGPDQPSQHFVRGSLETTIFVGSLQVFLVRALGTLLHVHLLAGGSGSPFNEGEEVLVAFSPEHVQIFAD
jgi:mannopine transport system ATP-binding protein